jgi:hypothetical protein
MRFLLALGLLCRPALADDAVRGNEVIVIEGSVPPAVSAKPKTRQLPVGDGLDDIFQRVAPPYSDRAILSDTWTVAWMLLDIDDTGRVQRVKFLRRPGYDLEPIAIRTALALAFEPARGARGEPIRSYTVWPIEWPSYGWLHMKTGLASGIPDTSHVPCRGSGPLHVGSMHPVYKDCSQPDLAKIDREPWQSEAVPHAR